MNNQINILELDRFLGSIHYTIPTVQILSLKKTVEEWISMNDYGAIIYGKSRSGKTRAIHYISEQLRKKYGTQLPIYTYCATDHKPTDRNFYSNLLVAIGHEEQFKGTAVQLKQRLLNRMIVDALDTKYRRIILFIDEAFLLDAKEYLWLVNIYNSLNLNDILLTIFLFGTNELKEQKARFIRANKEQIVLRFMLKEFHFKGITSISDLSVCMHSLDKPFYFGEEKQEIVLSNLFFPIAYADGMKLGSYTNDLWDAFEKVKLNYNVNTDEILMKFFMDTIIYCLRKYGTYGEKLYAPTIEEWENAMIKVGFVSSQLKQ